LRIPPAADAIGCPGGLWPGSVTGGGSERSGRAFAMPRWAGWEL
jgi:hypothetical protein